MACLDTAFLLDLGLRARARRKLEALAASEEALTTTRFNVAELWVSVERSSNMEEETAAVRRLISPLIILDFHQDSAEVFGRSMAVMMRAGKRTGDMDLLIASVALVHGQSLVTRNLKHFTGIPGLRVESY